MALDTANPSFLGFSGIELPDGSTSVRDRLAVIVSYWVSLSFSPFVLPLESGADEIVMHPFAELGPIDPTVSNEFNPTESGRRLGISVEDVKAYVTSFVCMPYRCYESSLIRKYPKTLRRGETARQMLPTHPHSQNFVIMVSRNRH
jgi:hypothetical protein